MKNNRNVTFVSRPCFDNMFHVIYAHEWMNNAQVHEMQVQLCKQNTRGVTEACKARLQVVLDIVIVPNRILYL